MHRVVSDVLSYQRRLGRVRRVSYGMYEAVPASMSPSMRSRCRGRRHTLGTPDCEAGPADDGWD